MDGYWSATPLPHYINCEQIDCAYMGIMAEQHSDTKSTGGQFVEEFNVKIDSLTEKVCRVVEEKFNSYILSKGSKPIFSQEQKPINPELSANDDVVAMLDFSGDIGVLILPDEFHAKEVDEHQDDGARNLENTDEMLEGHKGTNQDIIQVNKSPCFSNTSDKVAFTGNVGGSSTRKQIQMPKSRGQEKSLVAGAHVSVQKASVQKKVIELGEHACIQQLENVHHVSMKREASSAELVTSQNLPKSSGGNGSQPRDSHSLSNWQKKQLEKLSAEKLKKRGMAWVPKGSVQVHNEKDAKVEVKARKEKGARRRAPNQRSASNHQVIWPLHYLYSSPISPMPMSWNPFSGMYDYPSWPYYNSWISYESLYYGGCYHIVLHID
uniref:Uncharacterized protein n=1 Tax=Oryza meridionalis TaxID=40149 RepID=A0A0E0D2N4_9ORYZ